MALRDDAPRVPAPVVVAMPVDAADGDPHLAAAGRLVRFLSHHRDRHHALATLYFAFHLCLARGDVAEAWITAFFDVNHILLMLSVSGRRIHLSLLGSAAERWWARLDAGAHLLALFVVLSMVLRVYGTVVFWATLAAVFPWFHHKLGLFD